MIKSIRGYIRRQIKKAAEKRGFLVFEKSYYLPIPDKNDLDFCRDTDLAGINIDEKIAFGLLDEVLSKYKKEFNAFPVGKTDDPQKYYLLNGGYMAIDGNVYYSLIRNLKPAKIIEIGSGNSTLLAAHAIAANRRESGVNSKLICIEPYPSESLKNLKNSFISLVEKKVQEVRLEEFNMLQANDILFIDSSHVLKSGGDVWWEYCEILPRLKSGVYVHIHDISLPKPYPTVYFDQDLFFNEQYLLQAFLTHNDKFEIIWPGNYLMSKYPEKMKAFFSPEYDLMRGKYPYSEPTGFWMKVK
jgi:predicted O-methyltransferase YrrM